MSGYKQYIRCKNCMKIYKENEVQKICKKCGVQLTEESMLFAMFGMDKLTDNAEKVIAKKGLFGRYDVRKSEI